MNKRAYFLEVQKTSQRFPGNQKLEGFVYLLKGKFVGDELFQLYNLKS
jgi:predicted RNA-binding protein with TRAM domain